MGDTIFLDATLLVLVVPADGGLRVVRLLHAAQEAQVVEERDQLTSMRETTAAADMVMVIGAAAATVSAAGACVCGVESVMCVAVWRDLETSGTSGNLWNQTGCMHCRNRRPGQASK